MKKRFSKILGVGLALALLASLFLFAIPVMAVDPPIDLAVNGENPWTSQAFIFTEVFPSESLASFPVKFENVGTEPGELTFSMGYVENDMTGAPAPDMTEDEFASLVYVAAVTHQYFGGSYPDGGGIHNDLPNWMAMDLNEDGKVSLYELNYYSPIPWATETGDTLPAGEASEFVITFCLGNSLDGGVAGGAILSDADNASQGDGISITVSATLGDDTETSSGNVFQAGTTAVEMTAASSGEIIGISVTPASVDFGSVDPGQASATQVVTITNAGNVDVDLSASLANVSSPDVYTTGLTMEVHNAADILMSVGLVSAWTSYESVIPGGSRSPGLVLEMPSGTPAGSYTATLIFWAEASP